MPVFGPSKLEAELFGEKPDPMRQLHDKYWSKAKQAPEKEMARAMKKAGYNTDVIIASLKRRRHLTRLREQGPPLADVKTSRRAPRKKQPKRVLHAKYLHVKSQSEALEEL